MTYEPIDVKANKPIFTIYRPGDRTDVAIIEGLTLHNFDTLIDVLDELGNVGIKNVAIDMQHFEEPRIPILVVEGALMMKDMTGFYAGVPRYVAPRDFTATALEKGIGNRIYEGIDLAIANATLA